MHDQAWSPGGYHVLLGDDSGPVLTMLCRHFLEVGWLAGTASRGDGEALEQLRRKDPGTAQLVTTIRGLTQP